MRGAQGVSHGLRQPVRPLVPPLLAVFLARCSRSSGTVAALRIALPTPRTLPSFQPSVGLRLCAVRSRAAGQRVRGRSSGLRQPFRQRAVAGRHCEPPNAGFLRRSLLPPPPRHGCLNPPRISYLPHETSFLRSEALFLLTLHYEGGYKECGSDCGNRAGRRMHASWTHGRWP